MTPVEAVLKAARLFAFVREEPKGSNAGQAVEHFQRHTGNRAGDPWCCSFVCTILDGMLGATNQLPTTASCQALADAARQQKRLKTTPEPGALFLLWFPTHTRFAHVGFLVSKNADGSWETVEGNTGDAGEREGYGVFTKRRTFAPADRFIRWWDS